MERRRELPPPCSIQALMNREDGTHLDAFPGGSEPSTTGTKVGDSLLPVCGIVELGVEDIALVGVGCFDDFVTVVAHHRRRQCQ
jgi:hypothetical protein